MTAITAPYILPTGTKLNPADPAGEYYSDEQTLIIVKTTDTGRYRVLTSYGRPTDWNIGSLWDIRHDQTGAKLGIVQVVGLRSPGSEPTGEVPAKFDV